MAWVHVYHETSLDSVEDEYSLWLQWCRYNYDDGNFEFGYRFIWRNQTRLMPTRGQARIPSRAVMDGLLKQATAEGWGNLDEATFSPKPSAAA